MAVDHRTGHRRGRLSPNAADRVGHKLLAWGVSRDGRDCLGHGRSGRPTHDSSVDVRRQPPHGCGIRAEQRSSTYWRIGCYSPYRTCDSVIRTCLAFSFWCRRSDGRSHLLGSSGERLYVDLAGGESPTTDTTMTTARHVESSRPNISSRLFPSEERASNRSWQIFPLRTFRWRWRAECSARSTVPSFSGRQRSARCPNVRLPCRRRPSCKCRRRRFPYHPGHH